MVLKKLIAGVSSLLVSSAMMAAPNLEGIQVYQKNTHYSEERKQSLANDIDFYNNADNMWDVLRQEFSLPHYEETPQVQQQIQWFLNHQDFLLSCATRSAPYLYYILQQVRLRHLPAEFVLLPMIESAYNPFAYSSAGAAGIWQLMPGTASGYGIKQNWWYDGRRDLVASTKAALNHISYLGSFFGGNWLLAIAAYDTGEGNVLSAIRRNYRDARDTDFWSLPVAQETRDYVPRLLALAAIISHPDEYPIPLPIVHNAPYLAQIDIGAQINLKQAAYLAGLSLKKLMQFNPGYNRSVINTKGPFKLVLPIENAQQFTENLENSPLKIEHNFSGSQSEIAENILKTQKPVFASQPSLPRETKPTPPTPTNYSMQPGDTLYMVRNGDTLAKIAAHFKVTTTTLVAVNHLNSLNVNPGTNLLIPTHQEQKYQLTPGDTIYMVRQGDDIDRIAAKFHMQPAEIRLANMLASNNVQEGDRIIIPTHG